MRTRARLPDDQRLDTSIITGAVPAPHPNHPRHTTLTPTAHNGHTRTNVRYDGALDDRRGASLELAVVEPCVAQDVRGSPNCVQQRDDRRFVTCRWPLTVQNVSEISLEVIGES